MPQSPKHTGDKISLTGVAWEQNAPQAKFGGLTLAQFKAAAQPCLEAREKVNSLEIQLQAERVNRDIADTAINETILVVVNSMKGDPNYGEDSPLYAAMGYVRKSQRKSGLKRGSKQPESDQSKTVKLAV